MEAQTDKNENGVGIGVGLFIEAGKRNRLRAYITRIKPVLR